MRILVAPQEFKGTLSPAEAAAAIAAGCQRALPGVDVDVLPLSDGGPGFIEALAAATPAERRSVSVHDAIGRPVRAQVLLLEQGRTIAIESAQANGLALLLPDRLDPLYADTFGVGELMAFALSIKPGRILVGVGGSATTDGGSGMARALGARFLDGAGNDLPRGGSLLVALERIDWQRPAAADGVEFIVASDVTSPLTGPEGAARVFAPQKGATPEQVAILEEALLRYAAVVRRSLGVDVATLPGAGAAGGLAAGLVAFLGARIVSGFDVVARATGLDQRVQRADLVITGEGSFDEQSARGKVTGRLLDLATAQGKRAIVLAGRAGAPGPGVHSLAEVEADVDRQMADAGRLLQELAERVMARLVAPRRPRG